MILFLLISSRLLKKRSEELKQQQEEADERLNNTFDNFWCIGIGVSMIIGSWLGWHFGGGLAYLLCVCGLLGGLVGGLILGWIVLGILKATGKFIVSEDGKLKFKRK